MTESLIKAEIEKPAQGNKEILNDLFHDLFLILSLASMPDAKIDQGDWSDPIKTIIDDLKINRLVTLNYDTELERYFLQKKAYKVEKEDHLLMPNQEVKSRKVAERRNGFGARFTSVTLEKNIVGKLLHFAASSKRNHSYIFHLHGRGDCAEGLILTESDYQELYVRSSASRRAFSEGIDTLFSGNDVLFLGVGMNESDLLKPLRQFVSESQDISLRHHGILALLSEDRKPQRTEEQALKLHTKYGVKSMFYDPKTKDLDNDINQLKKISVNKASQLYVQLSLMESSRKKVGKQSLEFDKKLKTLALEQQNWWKNWRKPPGKRVAKYIDWSTNKENSPERPRLWIRQKICLLHRNSKIGSILSSEKPTPVLQEIIENIENDVKIINEASSELRGIHRYAGSTGVGKGAIVHFLQQYCQEEITADQYLGCFFSDAKFSTEYTSVISALSRFLAGIIADQIWNGKNTYIANQSLPVIEGDIDENESDLSRIVALNKALTTTAKKKYKNESCFRNEAEEEKTFDKQWIKEYLGIDLPNGKTRILQAYLDCFSPDNNISSVNKPPRILVCLSGLDRLVDKNGYAFNALHRSFFKVLTSPENCNVPLTLILFSDRPDIPIRYLSEFEKKLDKNGEQRDWDSQKAKLKRWNLVSKTEINERHWLPVCLIANTSLNKKLNNSERSRICDENLGILASKEEELAKRKSLHDVAYHYMSVHYWLRLLLREIQGKLDKNLLKREDADSILNSLDLSASRSGISGVIDQLLNIYDQFDTDPVAKRSLSGYQSILRHLALFTIPIERAVLANCPEVIEAIYDDDYPRSEKETTKEIEGYLKTLHKTGLLIKIERNGIINSNSGESEEQDYRYTLASIMRQHISQKMDFSAYVHGEFSFFDVSLYPTQPLDIPSPKERDFIFIGQILQTMISDARLNLDYIEKHNKPNIELDSQHSISRIIRAAVNLVNGSFSIGVVSRLEKADLDNIEFNCGHAQPFEAYSRWLRCLSNIAVAIEKKVTEEKLPGQKPLYETEAAWLFNEQGLVNLIQGRLFDALHLFRLAKQRLNNTPWVNTDDVESYPSLTSLRRVELNHAIAMLDSGKIKEAESEFYRLYIRGKIEKRNKTSLTVHLACGYLGFCYHLQGRMTQAEERYIEALEFFKKENKNFLRVTAIFRMHYGNLKRMLNDYKDADLFLNIAISSAASAKQMDIYHHASVSKAKLLLTKAEKGYATEAIALLNSATTYAEKMGVYRLKVHADIIRGEVLVSQKQYTIAGKLLANAIAVSNKHGMRIMKLRALKVYANALICRRSDQRVIDDILSTAKHLSEETGYLIKWVKED